jgi:hypothetical protein
MSCRTSASLSGAAFGSFGSETDYQQVFLTHKAVYPTTTSTCRTQRELLDISLEQTLILPSPEQEESGNGSSAAIPEVSTLATT